MFGGELGTLPGQLHLGFKFFNQTSTGACKTNTSGFRDELVQETERMEHAGAISRVEQPTNWISPLVIVKKANARLRICMDPKHLNQALKRCHYPMITIDDLLPQLPKAKRFSIFDVQNGFWHAMLDEDTSLLTTFATPVGLYR